MGPLGGVRLGEVLWVAAAMMGLVSYKESRRWKLASFTRGHSEQVATYKSEEGSHQNLTCWHLSQTRSLHNCEA